MKVISSFAIFNCDWFFKYYSCEYFNQTNWFLQRYQQMAPHAYGKPKYNSCTRWTCAFAVTGFLLLASAITFAACGFVIARPGISALKFNVSFFRTFDLMKFSFGFHKFIAISNSCKFSFNNLMPVSLFRNIGS